MARDPELDEFIEEPKPKVAPGAKRGPSVVPTSDAPRSGTPVWVIVVAVVGASGLLVVGVLASLAFFGVRRYVSQAKIAEGRSRVTALAQGMTTCFAETERLPETSARVPGDLSLVSGKKYQSAPDDWSDPAFRCAEFSMQEPQYFQYQWVLGEGQSGKAVAVADLDGDGELEVQLEFDVDCSGEACQLGAGLRETSPVTR
jgi:type IV pilus assembly protein PilA